MSGELSEEEKKKIEEENKKKAEEEASKNAQKKKDEPKLTTANINGDELIAKILSNPKFLDAIKDALADPDKKLEDQTKIIEKATKESTITKPTKKEVAKVEQDPDIALLKQSMLKDMIKNLSQETLMKFSLETDGFSLSEKKAWIDKNVITKTEDEKKASGLPSAGDKTYKGIFDPNYKPEWLKSYEEKQKGRT